MLLKYKVEKEVDIKTVQLSVKVRYWEDGIPESPPFRDGDMWNLEIDVDEGRIIDWPEGKTVDCFYKVCDEGSYYLKDSDGDIILSRENEYVPNQLIPGEYGDYIDLNVDEYGFITNWYGNPCFDDFIEDEY